MILTVNKFPPGDWRGVIDSLSKISSYVVGQLEKGKDTEHLHIQIYCHFKNPTAFSTINKIIPCHIENCVDPEAAMRYCQKDDTRVEGPYEIGEAPVFHRKKITREFINMTEEQLLELPLHQYIQANKAKKIHLETIQE